MVSARRIFSEYRLLSMLQECQADGEKIALGKHKIDARSKSLSIEVDQASTKQECQKNNTWKGGVR
jgi:hypothetical protein